MKKKITNTYLSSTLLELIHCLGWSKKSLALRWGIGVRRLNQIISSPTFRDLDAFLGLPSIKDDIDSL